MLNTKSTVAGQKRRRTSPRSKKQTSNNNKDEEECPHMSESAGTSDQEVEMPPLTPEHGGDEDEEKCEEGVECVGESPLKRQKVRKSLSCHHHFFSLFSFSSGQFISFYTRASFC